MLAQIISNHGCSPRARKNERSLAMDQKRHYEASEDPGAETDCGRLRRTAPNQILRIFVSLPCGIGGLLSSFLDSVAGLLRIVPDGVGRLIHRRRAVACGIVEKAFDGLAPFAGLALDEAQQPIDIAVERLHVIARQLAPLVAELPL